LRKSRLKCHQWNLQMRAQRRVEFCDSFRPSFGCLDWWWSFVCSKKNCQLKIQASNLELEAGTCTMRKKKPEIIITTTVQIV
jgi:hypothetical protein